MKGIDLSKFKKTHASQEHTVLSHPDGHKIHFSHKSLDKKTRSELEKLPHYDEGGDVSSAMNAMGIDEGAQKSTPNVPDYSQEQSAPEAPGLMDRIGSAMALNHDVGISPVPTGGLATTVDPKMAAVGKQEAPQANPAFEPQQQPMPEAPKPVQKPPSVGKAIVSPQPAVDTAKAMNDEYLSLKNDYLKNKIKPMAYADVAGKGTLGKVGTLFGLLVSGAGAGLTHQPNAVLEMMNREIERDFEAKKANQQMIPQMINAINQHHLAEAEIHLKGLQGKEAMANTGLIQANTALANQNLYKTNALLGMLGFLNNNVNKMPEGLQKEQYRQGLQTVSNSIDQKVGQMNNQTAQQMEINWQKRNTALNVLNPEMSRYESERHVPGIDAQASVPIPQSDRDKMESQQILDNKVRDLLDFSVQHRGTFDPTTRSRAAQKAEELISYYNNSLDKHGLGEGRLNWLDEQIKKNPTSIIQQVLGNNERMREIRDSNMYRQDVLRKKYGLPEAHGAVGGGENAPVKGADGKMYRKSADGKYMVPVK